MPRSEFEEKQYEGAANAEICLSPGDLFPSGQVLEASVSYDAAFLFGSRRAWSRLGLLAPRGVFLRDWFPNEADKLPSKRVSLLVQYKRPYYISRRTAWGSKQWDLWNKPYFKFELSSPQHDRLMDLETRLRKQAVVRYAAPAFWRFADLEASAESGRIIEHSSFVSPTRIGTGHNWLTYDRPTRIGKANAPTDDDIQLEDRERLERILLNVPVQETTWDGHVESVVKELGVSDSVIEDLYKHLDYLPEEFYGPYFMSRRAYAKHLALSRYFILRGVSWYSFRAS